MHLKSAFFFIMKDYSKYIWHSIVLLAFLVIVWQALTVFIYIALAFVLLLLTLPVRNFLVSFSIFRKLNWLMSLLTMALVVSLLIVVVNVLTPILVQEAHKIYQTDTKAIAQNFEPLFTALRNKVETLNLPELDEHQAFIQEKLVSIVNIGNIPLLLKKITSFTGSILTGIFAVSFMLFFLLKDYERMKEGLLSLFSNETRPAVHTAVHNARALLQRYIIGIFTEITCVFFLTAIGMKIIGSESVMLIALLVAVLNLIPYLGPLISATICTLLGIFYHLSEDLITVVLPIALSYISVFLVVQLIDNLVLQPFIYSNSVKAHPLEIFIVLLIAGSLGGILAMVVAIPFYTILKVFFRYYRSIPN